MELVAAGTAKGLICSKAVATRGKACLLNFADYQDLTAFIEQGDSHGGLDGFLDMIPGDKEGLEDTRALRLMRIEAEEEYLKATNDEDEKDRLDILIGSLFDAKERCYSNTLSMQIGLLEGAIRRAKNGWDWGVNQALRGLLTKVVVNYFDGSLVFHWKHTPKVTVIEGLSELWMNPRPSSN